MLEAFKVLTESMVALEIRGADHFLGTPSAPYKQETCSDDPQLRGFKSW